MNMKQKLKALGTNYKVEQKNMSLIEWSNAIKKVANRPNDSIEVLYDEVILKKPKETAPPKVIEGKAVEISSKAEANKVEGCTYPVSSPVEQSVAVSAPAQHFHLAPASVVVNSGDVNWSYTLMRAAQYAFVFMSGTMFGMLISGVVMTKIRLAGGM